MLHHGLTVGMARNVDLLVIELFTFLHDSRRRDERRDRGQSYIAPLPFALISFDRIEQPGEQTPRSPVK